MDDKLKDIPQGAFALAEDRKIRKVMQKLKVFDWAAKEISRLRYEKYSRLAYTAGAIKCGAGVYDALFNLLSEICAAFDLQCPELYVCADEKPYAKLIGEENPLVVVSSGMLKLVTKEEMKCVLAQQVSHIHCGHEKFLMARELLNSAADNLGILKGVVAPVRMLLEEWYVLAQMSVDRGALLVSGDEKVLLALLAKLAGGAVLEWGGVGSDALLEQYKNYSAVKDETPACPVFKTWSSLYLGVPPYVLRAGRINEWAQGGGYADFMSGNFPDDVKVSEQEAEAFWGKFAGAGNVWEAVDTGAGPVIDEQVFFGIGNLNDEMKKMATGAEKIIRVGAEAAGKAAESFADAIFKATGMK